ncbi:MAG: metallophosphoesterase family protein [Candidatus Paceibacterota bacterium]
MKIAIISDAHDNMANLEKFLEVTKREGIEGIIHCGDVTTPETLDWLAENFAGPIKLADGNMEIRREEFGQVVERHKNLEVFPEIGVWELEIRGAGTKIAFTHRPNKNEELAQTKAYSFVFYGHTHKPWISQIGSVLVANPGTLGGVFTAPTYATLDTDIGQLALHRL